MRCLAAGVLVAVGVSGCATEGPGRTVLAGEVTLPDDPAVLSVACADTGLGRVAGPQRYAELLVAEAEGRSFCLRTPIDGPAYTSAGSTFLTSFPGWSFDGGVGNAAILKRDCDRLALAVVPDPESPLSVIWVSTLEREAACPDEG